jgi:hypothetical protein
VARCFKARQEVDQSVRGVLRAANSFPRIEMGAQNWEVIPEDSEQPVDRTGAFLF